MLTCHDLDGLVEQLCDLTREMEGLQRAREATELLDLMERVPQRFLMEWRAAAVADLHYLDGIPLRKIAEHLDRSYQAVSQWLQNHGPTHYVCLIKEDDRPVRATLFEVEGEQTKVKIRQFWRAGRRIVPATMNLARPEESEGVPPGTQLGQLWKQLGPLET